jgi:hypothetical protein
MIQKFIERFDAAREALRVGFTEKHPESYADIVKRVVAALNDEDDYDAPDPERVHQIDDGDYQGTLVFIIGCKGYQPSTYWGVLVSYGSCSGCDTFEAIRCYGDDTPTPEQVGQYMTLATHIVQGIREIGGGTSGSC